jgi:hypothetical protein
MRLTRRNALIGLGTVAAGAGVVGGSGAFTSVTANRTVNVQTTGDASAFLALEPATADDTDNGEYADDSNDQIQITLNADADAQSEAQGLNKNAETVIRDIVKVTNNGTQSLTSLSLSIEDSGGTSFPDVFSFTTSVDSSVDLANGDDVLQGNGLDAGNSVQFGMSVDLRETSDGDLPGTGDYTLTIEAQTANSN